MPKPSPFNCKTKGCGATITPPDEIYVAGIMVGVNVAITYHCGTCDRPYITRIDKVKIIGDGKNWEKFGLEK